MGRLTKTAYILGILCFLISCSFAIFYGYKIFTHDIPKTKKTIEEARYHFVLVPEELDNEYWRLVEKGAKAAAKHYGVVLEYVGPKQANIDEHLKTIEMSAAAKVDGVITQGLSNKQFTPLINRVVSSYGIPVITIDTDAANSQRIAYIGTDNYHAGYLAGKALIADTKGKANVAIITGSFYANHMIQRVKGFKDAVKKAKGIHIVAIEESQISRIRAAEKAYQIMQEHPEVNAFYGTSALDGISIAKVVELKKREHDIYIIGFDVLPETIANLQKGTINATVVQQPYEMGYGSVKMMVELMEKKHIPPIVHTETQVIRKKDLSDLHQNRMEAGKKNAIPN
ncbi:sugar-binding protein [Neobacillus sp. M.A.Huq-85]